MYLYIWMEFQHKAQTFVTPKFSLWLWRMWCVALSHSVESHNCAITATGSYRKDYNGCKCSIKAHWAHVGHSRWVTVHTPFRLLWRFSLASQWRSFLCVSHPRHDDQEDKFTSAAQADGAVFTCSLWFKWHISFLHFLFLIPRAACLSVFSLFVFNPGNCMIHLNGLQPKWDQPFLDN